MSTLLPDPPSPLFPFSRTYFLARFMFSTQNLRCDSNPSAIKCRGNPWAGGVTSFYRLARRGGFSEGLGTSRRRRQSGADTSSRPLTGTGERQITSLSPDRGSTHHVVAAYQGTLPSLRLSVGKFLPSLIQSVPIPSTRFFFLFDYRIRHCARFDTYPPGAFGRNGFHGESA
jgi:hypothetical protein